MRMVDLANLTLSPLINPMTNPFPHANESCSSAQGQATLAQLGEKEDNGTCPGPRRKNNRHGSLWELFTSVHFHKDMWKNSPAVLSVAASNIQYPYKENTAAQACSHMMHRDNSYVARWLSGCHREGQQHITSRNEQRQLVFCTNQPISHFVRCGLLLFIQLNEIFAFLAHLGFCARVSMPASWSHNPLIFPQKSAAR